ncbi:MAG: preprotein translocase subunit YajC [Actinobacteria bacterium]|nr:preprotein translocase subunit YajC [Actinomycetota bacterium]MCL5072602.1 preprotein translocase subunit YajC [Actinomycetota bacterium]
MSKKIIAVIVACILLIGISAVFVGCSALFPTTTTTAASTAAGATTATTEAPTGFRAIFASYGTWIWLVILAVAFYFLLIRPQRTRSKKAQDLLRSIQRGDEIVTIGGFYGRVKDVREDSVIITIAGGVDVKISKSAVARNLTGDQNQKTPTAK